MRRNRQKSSRARKRQSSRSTERKSFQPRTVEQFFAMPKQDQEFWRDVGHVLTDMRSGASRAQASRKYKRDPRKVLQAAPSAFRKLKNGRYAAKAWDRLLRVLVVPTRKGLAETGFNDSRQATILGEYWNTVELYRDTGDASELRKFRGEYVIDGSGKRIPLLTNLRELDRLGSAGVLSFESLYARVA